MSALALQNASVRLGGATILNDVSFEVPVGKMVGLLGPNGAGKTSAVRALLGLQALSSGRAVIQGKDAVSLPAKDLARAVSYLPQSRALAWPISVQEAVALGRFAYGNPMGRLSDDDHQAVARALAACDLSGFANRSVASLSGGELARVHLARALASGAPAIIADEPTNALDPRHSFDILNLLKSRAQQGCAVLVILHDLSLAAQFCDDIVLLNQGCLVASGGPDVVLNASNLAAVYRVEGVWGEDGLRVVGPAPE